MIGHPLFPARDDVSEPPEVLAIHVTRAGEGWATRTFAPEELTSLESLYELFGGGHYTLISRDERKITSRQTYTIPGPSRPLNDGAGIPGGSLPATLPAPLPAAAPAVGGSGDFMLAVLQMMQHSSDNTNKIFSMMMQQGQESQRRHIESMQALHDRSVASQGELTRAILEARTAAPGSDTSAEWFMRGQKHGEAVADKLGRIADRLEPEDDEGRDLIDEIAGLVGPLVAGVAQHQAPAAAPVPAPAPMPAPPTPAPAGNGAGRPTPVDFRPQGRPIYQPDESDLDQ